MTQVKFGLVAEKVNGRNGFRGVRHSRCARCWRSGMSGRAERRRSRPRDHDPQTEFIETRRSWTAFTPGTFLASVQGSAFALVGDRTLEDDNPVGNDDVDTTAGSPTAVDRSRRGSAAISSCRSAAPAGFSESNTDHGGDQIVVGILDEMVSASMSWQLLYALDRSAKVGGGVLATMPNTVRLRDHLADLPRPRAARVPRASSLVNGGSVSPR